MVSKWVCKICQERQSTKQEYSRGSGAECRKVVQELNWKRMELSTAREEQLLDKEEVEDVQEELFDLNYETENIDDQEKPPEGRWAAFLPPPTLYRKEAVVETTESDQTPVKKARLGWRQPLSNKPSPWDCERQVTVSSASSGHTNNPLTSSSCERKTPAPGPVNGSAQNSLPPTKSKWSKFVIPTQVSSHQGSS